MRELVCLLEETSARSMLEALLPRVLDARIQRRLIAFEGKQDLAKQLPGKLRGYLNPRARFLVLRDQDSAPDCRTVKSDLLRLCEEAGRGSACLVRIACRELETMYLADLQAVEAVTGIRGLAKRQQSKKFRNPDGRENPSRELQTLTVGRYQKVSSSRLLGDRLDLGNTRSSSFKQLLLGIRRLETELLELPDEPSP